MKIYDCITYFDEPMLFDLRLNILGEYVDKFIVIEAKHTHSGNDKKLNFEKNNFKKFKNAQRQKGRYFGKIQSYAY